MQNKGGGGNNVNRYCTVNKCSTYKRVVLSVYFEFQ